MVYALNFNSFSKCILHVITHVTTTYTLTWRSAHSSALNSALLPSQLRNFFCVRFGSFGVHKVDSFAPNRGQRQTMYRDRTMMTLSVICSICEHCNSWLPSLQVCKICTESAWRIFLMEWYYYFFKLNILFYWCSLNWFRNYPISHNLNSYSYLMPNK